MTSLDWNAMLEAAGDDGTARVPDGWYDCVVKSTKVGQTSNGYKKINARLVVESGPYAGASLFKDFVITFDKPGGMKFFFRHMDVLGVSREFIKAQQPTPEELAAKIMDQHAQVEVGTEVWNNEPRMRIKDLKALPGTPGGSNGFAFGEPVTYAVPTSAGPVPVVAQEAAPVAPVAPVLDFSTNELPPEPPF